MVLIIASGMLADPRAGEARPFLYPQIAQSTNHPPSMTCYNYGDHVRCENGQVYILPSRVGSPVIVQPLPKKPLELSDAARKTFDRILKNSLRDAKSYCRQLRIEAIGARKACIRQQLDRFVLVTRDEDLITYYEAEFKNKVKY